MNVAFRYFIIILDCSPGLSVVKQIYVLKKNGAHRRRHRFDCRQHNCPLG
jgi:hypothetical protein